MKLNRYYICDKDGYIKNKVSAYTLINEAQPNGKKVWVLKYLNGLNEHILQGEDESICHEYTWVNPDSEFTDKVQKGREKEFEFFMEHGYHMPRKVKNADD